MPSRLIQPGWLETVKPPTSGQVDYLDTKLPGLGLRVGSKGTKTWFVRWRSAEGRERFTIGRYPKITLAQAREQATEILLRIQRGGNPVEDKKAEEKAEAAACTFKGLATEYLDRHASKKRTVDEQRRILEKDVIPAWEDRKAKDITRADVIRLVEGIAEGVGDRKPAPIMANRTLNLIGRVFRWGIKRGLVEQNPAAGTDRPGEERERDRVLSDDEMRSVWAAATGQVGSLLKLALLTGQRRGEIERMRWQDVDLDDGWWTIPAEHAKNKHAHRVPLSELALGILEELEVAQKERPSPWVFPSRIGGGTRAINNIQKRVDEIRTAAGDGDWHFHDLRRTAATGMARAGVKRLVIGKVLNHLSSAEVGLARVTGIYDRHEYDDEKRDALDRWAKRLADILSGKPAKVRELRSRRPEGKSKVGNRA